VAEKVAREPKALPHHDKTKTCVNLKEVKSRVDNMRPISAIQPEVTKNPDRDTVKNKARDASIAKKTKGNSVVNYWETFPDEEE